MSGTPRFKLLSQQTSDGQTLTEKYLWKQGADVPGGHNVMLNKHGRPFMPCSKECRLIELRFSDVFVDIGAFVGTYAIRAARLPVYHSIAYEPSPQSFAVLSLSRQTNLTLFNAAVVGDLAGAEVELYLKPGVGTSNSLLPARGKTEHVTVMAFPYRDVIRAATVVKLDVEGAEYSLPIVEFIPKQLRAIAIDFHPVGDDWIERARAIVAGLEAAGFVALKDPTFQVTDHWRDLYSTSSGAWIREVERPKIQGYMPMLSGMQCCGCGALIAATSRALCKVCWPRWMKRHRVGYQHA